jgi:hypothetical protein
MIQKLSARRVTSDCKQRHRNAARRLLDLGARIPCNQRASGHRMTAERPGSGETRVVPLRPRHPQAGNDNRPAPLSGPARPDPAIGDLMRFERKGDDHDDYRHRMLVNALAFVVCIFLVLAGVWLATKLAQMRKDQDCVLSGRRGCTPVEVPVHSRW